MKSKIILLALFILGLMLINSCKKEEVDSKQTALIPLKTGNYWVVVDSIYNMYNWTVNTSKTEVGKFVSINGSDGFINIQNEDNPYHLNFLSNNDTEGNVVNIGGYSDKDTLINPSIEFKNKPYKGEVWQFNWIHGSYTIGTLAYETVNIKCSTLDTLIVVPKGSFKCNVYEFELKQGIYVDKFIYFISCGTGIVKSQHFEGRVLQRVSCLIDYKIK